MLQFTDKELEDINRALVIAMQVIDKLDSKSLDHLLADRLELIKDKIDRLRN